MNTTYNLDQLTAALADRHARAACITVALVKHVLGPAACEDPALLDHFLSTRGVSSPVKLMVKAAVAAIDSSSGLAPSRPMVQAFIGAVDRATVLGSIGAVRVPSTNVVGATQTSTASAFWVGEQAAKPMTSLGFVATSLRPFKVVADVAVTAELLKTATADALGLIERGVVSAVASAIDTALLDPANAGIANIKPASLTNGLVGIVPAGDFQNQVGQALAGISSGAPSRPVLIASLQSAMRLTGLRDLEAAGVKVIVTPAAGSRLIAVDADGVVFTDDGGAMKIGTPDIQMSDTPDATSTTTTVSVSSWQRNQVVVRGERWTNWAKRADAVAFVTLA